MPAVAILLAAASAERPVAIKINRLFGALTLPAMVMALAASNVSVLADSQVSAVPGASLCCPHPASHCRPPAWRRAHDIDNRDAAREVGGRGFADDDGPRIKRGDVRRGSGSIAPPRAV